MRFLPTPGDTCRINDNLHIIRDGHVNFYSYAKGGDMVCVDAGFGSPTMKSELDKLGLNPSSISHLFFTHSDRDHVGGLKLFPNAKVYISSEEEQMINGEKKRFLIMNNRLGTDRYTLLADGEVVEVGDITVKAVATPGHTPGSMSYLIDGSVLCTGDTLVLRDGEVKPTMRLLNMDTQRELESIRKLAKIGGVKVLCTAHSGYTTDYVKAMRGWM